MRSLPKPWAVTPIRHLEPTSPGPTQIHPSIGIRDVSPAKGCPEPSLENGYAGSFFIFGHGGCFGDEGHCEVGAEPRPFDPNDPRRSHPLLPVEMSVEATEALRRTVSEGGDITVSVVPVITGFTEQTDLEDVLKFDLHPRIVAYETEVETA